MLRTATAYPATPAPVTSTQSFHINAMSDSVPHVSIISEDADIDVVDRVDVKEGTKPSSVHNVDRKDYGEPSACFVSSEQDSIVPLVRGYTDRSPTAYLHTTWLLI
jgi:hypothetical protein